MITIDAEIGGERGITIPSELSLLPIKDTVLFPMVVMPLIVSRESSMKLVDDAVVARPGSLPWHLSRTRKSTRPR